MKDTLYFTLIIVSIIWLNIWDTAERKGIESTINANHKIVLEQIQKQIEADTKFINALEAVLKGE